MYGDTIDWSIPLQHPENLFTSLWVLLGFWMLEQLYYMCYYEWKMYKGAGWDFMRFGRMYVIRMNVLVNKISSTRNKGIQK